MMSQRKQFSPEATTSALAAQILSNLPELGNIYTSINESGETTLNSTAPSANEILTIRGVDMDGRVFFSIKMADTLPRNMQEGVIRAIERIFKEAGVSAEYSRPKSSVFHYLRN